MISRTSSQLEYNPNLILRQGIIFCFGPGILIEIAAGDCQKNAIKAEQGPALVFLQP